MQQTIRIHIKEYHDFTHPYFLATSPDVEGFMVQENSVEEVLQTVKEFLPIFLEETAKLKAQQKTRNQKRAKKGNLIDLSGKIMMRYSYESPLVLHAMS